MIIDFDVITVRATQLGHVIATCTLCGGRKRWETPTLGDLVEEMTDHLARNHGPANSS